MHARQSLLTSICVKYWPKYNRGFHYPTSPNIISVKTNHGSITVLTVRLLMESPQLSLTRNWLCFPMPFVTSGLKYREHQTQFINLHLRQRKRSKKTPLSFCTFKYYPHLCSAIHLIQARRLANFFRWHFLCTMVNI